MIRLILFFVLIAAQAQAGAWPRAEGETFLSVAVESSFEGGDGRDADATIYAERGLANDLTLGFDANGDETDVSKAIGFLRWPIGTPGGPGLWAMEFGIGLSDTDFVLRPGLSHGRGLMLGATPGWLSIDSRLLIRDGLKGILETDITLGLKPAPDRMVILQMQTGAPSESSSYAKIAPSYVIGISPGRHLELGMTAGILHASEVTIKLGLWHRF